MERIYGLYEVANSNPKRFFCRQYGDDGDFSPPVYALSGHNLCVNWLILNVQYVPCGPTRQFNKSGQL